MHFGGSSAASASAMADQGLERACGGFAQKRFQLGKSLLDRVEIGTVRRQVEQARAAVLDRGFDARNLVAR